MTIRAAKTCVLLALLWTGAAPLGAQESKTSITLLAEERVHEDVEALVAGGHLWLSEAAMKDAAGFELKPEGLCRDDLCIPVPQDGSWERVEGGVKYLDMSAFAEQIGQALVRDEDRGVWSLAQAPVFRGLELEMGSAPDFQLPDREGRLVSLSDFRGRKVLILTWASW